jgi:hypothetical protein
MGTCRKGIVFMAKPQKNAFDRIEFFIVKITIILMALVAAVKLLLTEIRSLLF